jgi:cephalosporin hydroxylase
MTQLHRQLASTTLRTGRALVRSQVVNAFHKLFYNSGVETWSNTRWLGVPTQKCAFDLWIYQELLHELRPAVIVECGTANGGSALFLASICDLLGKGSVVTIDIADYPERPRHDRVTYLSGSSTDPAIFAEVERFVAGRGPVLVILDSNHECQHVLDELRLYAPLVSPGSYLIIEDSNINGHPVVPDFGPGPTEALELFLGESDAFTVDRSREKLLLTFNPGGYLRKAGAAQT